jgi:hypothetical protein
VALQGERIDSEHRANRCNQIDEGSLWHRDRAGPST